jgi:hypothetical protein
VIIPQNLKFLEGETLQYSWHKFFTAALFIQGDGKRNGGSDFTHTSS